MNLKNKVNLLEMNSEDKVDHAAILNAERHRFEQDYHQREAEFNKLCTELGLCSECQNELINSGFKQLLMTANTLQK